MDGLIRIDCGKWPRSNIVNDLEDDPENDRYAPTATTADGPSIMNNEKQQTANTGGDSEAARWREPMSDDG